MTRCSAARRQTTSSRCLIGKGVEEIRIWEDSGTYRVIFTARLRDAVYVLHAFQKKTQATSKRDLDVARQRLAQVMKDRT